ncbi:MAG: hypothetical protein KUG53_04010 [Pseudomonadales bacterium]|nr:hypothetical protein [Pseudomonadales bacterium]
MKGSDDNKSIRALVFDALLLLNDRPGNIPKPNTFEHVRKLRKALRVAHDYPVLAGLNDSWEDLSSAYQEGFETTIIDRESESFESPLKAYLYYVDSGFFPPPEILLSVMQCFNIYYRSEGELSLEEVFFGPDKKWVGNESAREHKNNIFRFFRLYISSEKQVALHKKLPVPSLEAMAEGYLTSEIYRDLSSQEASKDVASFLRSYHRWNKAKREESEEHRDRK